VHDFLFDRVIHQNTPYSATPFVVPFVIEALANPIACMKKYDDDIFMKTDLLRFLHVCAMVSSANDELGREVAKGKPTYELFVGDTDAEIRNFTVELIDFCLGIPIPTPPLTPDEEKMLKQPMGFFSSIKSLFRA
jgi:hypothetical protein